MCVYFYANICTEIFVMILNVIFNFMNNNAKVDLNDFVKLLLS